MDLSWERVAGSHVIVNREQAREITMNAMDGLGSKGYSDRQFNKHYKTLDPLGIQKNYHNQIESLIIMITDINQPKDPQS